MLSLTLAKKYCVSPLKLNPQKLNDWEITSDIIKSGNPLPVISQRMAYLTRAKPATFTYDFDITIHKLYHNKGLIMSDSPQEMFMFAEAIHKAKSPVLIGGLGLGYIASQLALRGLDVTVVELERDVIDLVSPSLDPKIKVINADLNVFVKEHPLKGFKYVIYDTWTGTGESEWFYTVLPLLLNTTYSISGNKIYCWAQEEMIGQVINSVLATSTRPKDKIWWPMKVFYDGLPASTIKSLQTIDVVISRDIETQTKMAIAEAVNFSNATLIAFANLFARGLLQDKSRNGLWKDHWENLYLRARKEQEM